MNTVDVRRVEELTPPQRDWWAALWDRLFTPSESLGDREPASHESSREAANPPRMPRTVARRSERASA